MKKLRSFSGKKRCPDKETYKFVKGVAVVPGFELGHEPVTITVSQFRHMIEEIENDIKKGEDHSIGGTRSSCVGVCCSPSIKGD